MSEDFTTAEYEQMKAQKEKILDRESKRVFDAAMAALKVGAPGLSEVSKEGIAQNIALRLRPTPRL